MKMLFRKTLVSLMAAPIYAAMLNAYLTSERLRGGISVAHPAPDVRGFLMEDAINQAADILMKVRP